ncbi:MAG: hypothetical protein AAGN35_23665 [Bacteroidota bacterium]
MKDLGNKKFFTTWQYFREVEATPIDANGKKIGYPVIIRLQSKGQPKFQETTLSGAIDWGQFGTFDNFKSHYNIETWRLIHRQVVVPVRTNLVKAYQTVELLIKKSREQENNDKAKIDAYLRSQNVSGRDNDARKLAFDPVEASSLKLHLTPTKLVKLELIKADEVDDYQLTLSDYINAEMASQN